MDFSHIEIKKGVPKPFGLSSFEKGVNFSLFAKNATKAHLCLFSETSKDPLLEIPLNEKWHRTGDIWHIALHGLPDNLFYAYRLEGPFNPKEGHLYQPQALLIDPFAKSVLTSQKWGVPHFFPNPPKQGEPYFPPRSPLILKKPFDWENDKHPKILFEDLIIYEMHVRGFTKHASSETKHPGTFLGMMEKIPYLKKLGVNAVELMPIFEFDECENPKTNPFDGSQLFNYWGYSTLNFFSPMHRFSSSNAILEFKELVKALHKENIEVILDVVFNHSSEGNAKDYYLSFRGIDNHTYYSLSPDGEYNNYSGCGNTLNCNHPQVSTLILESLRFWVQEMHVDGFRFDLASILTRDERGAPLEKPPIIEMISNDPLLSSTKLIAEAWDPGGLYQVGSFPSWGKWAEWNGQYRDIARLFLKGTDGMIGNFAKRLCGSEDLYGKDRSPFHSINFITAHDGFTLHDLVTYQQKHNAANGEENLDGTDYNANWNCGIEGPTDNLEIKQLRERQIKNHFVTLMVSMGTPMLLMGDEYGHTRKGNNNAWCQDNALNWFLWDALSENRHLLRFFHLMIDFRKNHKCLRASSFPTEKEITWHGTKPYEIHWSYHDRFLAYTINDPKIPLYIAFNAHSNAQKLLLPPPPDGKKWHRIVDTNLASPDDFLENCSSCPLNSEYLMAPYSAFIAKALYT